MGLFDWYMEYEIKDMRWERNINQKQWKKLINLHRLFMKRKLHASMQDIKSLQKLKLMGKYIN